MMANTGSGAATLSTDGYSCAGKALSNAMCAMCGAVQSGVAAVTGAMTRLGQMTWMLET